MNTGAILNRINFGLAWRRASCPARQLAQLARLVRLAAHAVATQQVDGVVKSMLGGQVSPETRQVLMTGENPMLANGGAASDVNGHGDDVDSDVDDGGGRAGRQPIKRSGRRWPRGRAQMPGSDVRWICRDCRRSWVSRSARPSFSAR